MVAYSFKRMFVEPIRSGEKRQTIRAFRRSLRSRHANPGDALQLYAQMRTRDCELIARAVCSSTKNVDLHFYSGSDSRTRVMLISADGSVETLDTAPALDAFAWRDGFTGGWHELCAFWEEQHPEAVGVGLFEGVIIEWKEISK